MLNPGSAAGNVMRALFCAISLAVSIVALAAQTKPSLSTLTIVYRFEHAPSAIAFAELRRALSGIMEQSGFDVNWRSQADITPSESFTDLVTMGFVGTCSAQAVDAAADRGGALGRTYIADGKILRFSEVDCDRVRDSLRSPALRRLNEYPDRILGRALARVAAHELYHVLAQTVSHQSSGLAQRSFSPADLVFDNNLRLAALRGSSEFISQSELHGAGGHDALKLAESQR